MKRYLSLLFLLLVFSSCQHQVASFKTVRLEEDSTLFFEMGKVYNAYIKDFKVIEDIAMWVDDTALFLYEMKLHKIKNTIKLPDDFKDVFYVNDDSIFVINNPYRTNKDSILFLMNSKSEVLKYYTFGNLITVGYDTTYESNFLNFYPTSVVVNKNRLVVSLKRDYDGLIGNEYFMNNKTPLLVYFDLKTDNLNVIDLYDYPLLETGVKLDPGYFSQNLNIYDNTSVFLSFSYTPTIYKVNLVTGNYDIYNAKSFVLDTIPLPDYTTITQPIYSHFINSNSSNYFFRKMIYARGKYKFGFLVMDKEFNVIGEFVPENLTALVAENDNCLWYINGNIERDSTEWVFSKYKYSFYETDVDKWLDKYNFKSIQKEFSGECNLKGEEIESDMMSYLKTKITDSSYSVLVIPVGAACPGCIDFSLTQYMANSKYMKEGRVYLIVPGQNKDDIVDKLSNYYLSISDDNIIIDTVGEYFNVKKGYINIQYIIVDDNKVVFDKTYELSELTDMFVNRIFPHIDSLLTQSDISD